VRLVLSHPAEKTCIVFAHTYLQAYPKSEKGSMVYLKLDKPRDVSMVNMQFQMLEKRNVKQRYINPYTGLDRP